MTKEDILYRFKDINLYYNDCTAYDNLSRMLDDLISSAIAAGAALYEIKGKWTPVSEGLPKEDGRYWTYIVNKKDPSIKYGMACCFIQNSVGDSPWFPDDECASNNVVAWMPLPEDYKVEGEEDED